MSSVFRSLIAARKDFAVAKGVLLSVVDDIVRVSAKMKESWGLLFC